MFHAFAWFADRTTYGVLGLDASTRTADAVHFFVDDVTKIFFLLVTVIFVMGLFRSALSPERVRSFLEGRSRWAAYVMAVTLGAVTPFCSCSSVPLFIGFVEAGIPVGATMAFLIASPMINEVAVTLLLTLLGWKLTLLYVATGLAVGVAGGALVDALGLERWVEEYVWKIRVGAAPGGARRLSPRQRAAFAWGEVSDIVGRIWMYVLLGVGLGAVLHGYVPEDFFARWAGSSNPFAVPLAVVAGVPMYANATGIIPVAEALLGKGVPVGTVLALMMSVVALSLPEMIILRKVLKVRMLGFFAAYLAVAFVTVGYLFNVFWV
ncbi:MAG: permease [Gemmatimonadetes bacterium]|nr:permease [Gemmatimonadota bacterium]